MDKARRVFVSSTFIDNEQRRSVVQDAILSAGFHPVMMERFTASHQPAVEACLGKVEECGLYVGIVAWRYGWIPDGREISITELEYDAAERAGMERLIFRIDPKLPTVPDRDFDAGRDRWAKQEKLETFVARCSVGGMSALFREETLGLRVYQALVERERRLGGLPEKSVSAVSSLPEDDLAAYKRRLDELHRKLPLIGFRTQIQAEVDVKDLYVPLRAMVDRKMADHAGRLGDATEAERLFGESAETVNLSLTDAFWRGKRWGDHQGLVILGDPGSGKTTQLRRLLLCVLDDGADSLALPPDTLPVFLPLRELQDPEAGFVAFAEDRIQSCLPSCPGLGKRLLARGRLLFLIDGLDEVVDPRARQQVRSWVEEALKKFPDSRFVVTSRYAGYTEQARFDDRFLELHLRPLEKEQVETFIRNWHRSVARSTKARESEAEEKAQELIDRLTEPGFRSQKVFSLTRNPLLLTAVCLVNQTRGALPSGRAELYRECVDVLLEKWRQAQNIPIRVGADRAREVLQPMALHLHQEEERTRATADELAPILERPLVATRCPVKSPQEFLATIRDESGLLVGWGDDTFGFLHLGFQEYLTAREIRNQAMRDPEVLRSLARRFGESWWREVGLLLVALEEPSVFESYVQFLIEEPGFGEEANSSLVDELLDDASYVVPEPFLEVVNRSPSLDRDLWRRQLVAINALGRVAPQELEKLRGRLASHPFREIASRFGGKPSQVQSMSEDRSGIELIGIPAGKFCMGSTQEERNRWIPEEYRSRHDHREEPRHEVSISPFLMGRTPVTNEQYGRFLEANPEIDPPDGWGERNAGGPDHPVTGVSWRDARDFCEWAGGHLPTDAEWEYACRAGTETAWWTGNKVERLGEAAWYSDNSGGKKHPVGRKAPNAWGLYDVHGNVLEWCHDWLGRYPDREVMDPVGPSDGQERVLRGGSWRGGPRGVRSACRLASAPGLRFDAFGFRLALGQG